MLCPPSINLFVFALHFHAHYRHYTTHPTTPHYTILYTMPCYILYNTKLGRRDDEIVSIESFERFASFCFLHFCNVHSLETPIRSKLEISRKSKAKKKNILAVARCVCAMRAREFCFSHHLQ